MWKQEELSLFFCLIPGPSWAFISPLLNLSEILLSPNYTHVCCLDVSMKDTKNLGIF
jgi:hypothetical protein